MMDAATLFIPGTVEVGGHVSARIAPPDPGAINQARGAKLHTEWQALVERPVMERASALRANPVHATCAHRPWSI
jgi:hypothetical protein